MRFGNSEQNFGMIASKFTVVMWYTDPVACQPGSISAHRFSPTKKFPAKADVLLVITLPPFSGRENP